MLVRYGFDIDIQLWQPTTLITAMDVHRSQRNAIVEENEFQTSRVFAFAAGMTRKAIGLGD